MKENEIQPKDVFEEYLGLAEEDVQTFFPNAPRCVINCHACDKSGDHAFNKNDFDYALCRMWGTFCFSSPGRRYL